MTGQIYNLLPLLILLSLLFHSCVRTLINSKCNRRVQAWFVFANSYTLKLTEYQMFLGRCLTLLEVTVIRAAPYHWL